MPGTLYGYCLKNHPDMPMPACRPDYSYEARYLETNNGPIAGVDEVGRGPLAGPVMAAAVILDRTSIPAGLNDSKKLTQRMREKIFDRIIASAVIGIGEASVDEIDRLNIRRATHLAMQRAIALLKKKPSFVIVDGNDAPALPCPCDTIVRGDGKSVSIAAASIIAKVTRDRMMMRLHEDFPDYGWQTNMGYGTKAHLEGLKTAGITPHHRKSFAPVYQMLCPVNHGDSILRY
jgi:ribonuclease HII